MTTDRSTLPQVQNVRVLRWLLKEPAEATALQLIAMPTIEPPEVVHTAACPLAEKGMQLVEGIIAAAQDHCDGAGEVILYKLRWVSATTGPLGETTLGKLAPSDDGGATALVSHRGRDSSAAPNQLLAWVDRMMEGDLARQKQHHHAMGTLVRLQEQSMVQQNEMIRELRALVHEVSVGAAGTRTKVSGVEQEARALAIDKVTDALIAAAAPILPELLRGIVAPALPAPKGNVNGQATKVTKGPEA